MPRNRGRSELTFSLQLTARDGESRRRRCRSGIFLAYTTGIAGVPERPPRTYTLTREDVTINSAADPARQGPVLVISAIGEGQTDPVDVDGAFRKRTHRVAYWQCNQPASGNPRASVGLYGGIKSTRRSAAKPLNIYYLRGESIRRSKLRGNSLRSGRQM